MNPEENEKESALPPEPIQPQEVARARESEPPAPQELSPLQPEMSPPEPAPVGEASQPSVPEPLPPSSETVPAGRPEHSPDVPAIQPSVGQQAKIRKLERRLERVLVVARERGVISNRDIREAVHVSKATASRYARILISRGLLKKSGRTRSAKYEPK